MGGRTPATGPPGKSLQHQRSLLGLRAALNDGFLDKTRARAWTTFGPNPGLARRFRGDFLGDLAAGVLAARRRPPADRAPEGAKKSGIPQRVLKVVVGPLRGLARPVFGGFHRCWPGSGKWTEGCLRPHACKDSQAGQGCCTSLWVGSGGLRGVLKPASPGPQPATRRPDL